MKAVKRMAQRRMFSKDITTSDIFVDMPSSSQLLYFHLGMEADDEGFLGNAKMLSRAYGMNNDDLKLLEAKGFIITFPTGVTVIKDWKINNQIRKDRQKPTIYQQEKKLLTVDFNGSYLIGNQLATIQQPSDNQTGVSSATEVSIGKDSLVKNSLVKESKEYIVEQDFIFPDYLTEKSIESIKKGNPKNYDCRIPIAYLNQVTSKNYKYIDKSIKLIQARYNEQFNLEDFKKVIDTKVEEWANSDMEKYLRPETLFGSKFESYLNQKNYSNRLVNDQVTQEDDEYFKEIGW